MPRVARARSRTGFYHVMMRGNGRQILFEQIGDFEKFLRLLAESLAGTKLRLCAWCLMSNHVHLVVDDPADELSDAVHRVGTSFARYFNETTGHVGSVFQGRFSSVPIVSDAQLLQAVRYVHRNPVKAGLVARPADYTWSSYHEYLGRPQLIDPAPVLDLFESVEAFEAYMEAAPQDGYAFRPGKRYAEGDVLAVARAALGGVEPLALKAMKGADRNTRLRCLRAAGLTVRQIERVTGIGHTVIYKATTSK